MGETLDDQLAEIGDAAFDGFVEKCEKEQDPDLWVDQGLSNLIPFDLVVDRACSTESIASDQEGFLLNFEALGGNDVVWEV